MKPVFRSSCWLWLWCVLAAAQQPGSPAPIPAPASAGPSLSAPLVALLPPLERAAQTTSLDLAHLRIEKWKGDRAVKDDAAGKTESLERNLTGALPAMVEAVRANPNNLAPALKLYRNLNAVYDVLAFVTEAAGAFAPKDEYRALSADLQEIDTSRRALADMLENMATAQDQEVVRLRAQTQPPAPSQVKKIVVDDNEPAPKPAPKRRKKPAPDVSTPPTPPQPK
jgi:hypothetical protein